MEKTLWERFIESMTEEEREIWALWEQMTAELPSDWSKDERAQAGYAALTAEQRKIWDQLSVRWEEMMMQDVG